MVSIWHIRLFSLSPWPFPNGSWVLAFITPRSHHCLLDLYTLEQSFLLSLDCPPLFGFVCKALDFSAKTCLKNHLLLEASMIKLRASLERYSALYLSLFGTCCQYHAYLNISCPFWPVSMFHSFLGCSVPSIVLGIRWVLHKCLLNK